jgi:hypothetical protein
MPRTMAGAAIILSCLMGLATPAAAQVRSSADAPQTSGLDVETIRQNVADQVGRLPAA